MIDSMRQFFEALQNSKELQTKFTDAKGDTEKIINLAKESGYNISPDDLELMRIPISENLHKLLIAAQNDDILMAKLTDAQVDMDKIIAVAKESGYDISVNDFKMFETSTKGEISDDELDNVVGGYVLFMEVLATSSASWRAAIIDDTTGNVLCICSSGNQFSTFWLETAQKLGQSAEVIRMPYYEVIFGKEFPYQKFPYQ